jgi:hypothetical protein
MYVCVGGISTRKTELWLGDNNLRLTLFVKVIYREQASPGTLASLAPHVSGNYDQRWELPRHKYN